MCGDCDMLKQQLLTSNRMMNQLIDELEEVTLLYQGLKVASQLEEMLDEPEGEE